MCMHWQGDMARRLEKKVKLIDSIPELESLVEKTKARREENLKAAGGKLSHGFYGGNDYAAALELQIYEARISQLKGLNTTADLPPKNAIIIFRSQ